LARPRTGLYGDLSLDSQKKAKYPNAVFPISIHSQLFVPDVVSDTIYDQALDDFDDASLSPRSSPEDKILTTLALLLPLDQFSQEPRWDQIRLNRFIERFVSILNRLSRSFLTPVLRQFEVLSKRFATARFENEPLLADFRGKFIRISLSV
jgi:hypothetical protein